MCKEAAIVIGLCSIILQSAAAVRALLLVKLTKKKTAWAFISLALLLMAVRRIISLWLFIDRGQSIGLAFDAAGLVLSIAMVIGIWNIEDVFLEHIRAEERVTKLLEEKETILREAHHRIKNNMIAMGLLLENQAEDFKDPKVLEAFADARGRVEAMAVLYDKLYRSQTQGTVQAKEYLESLAREILVLLPGGEGIGLRVEADSIELSAGSCFSLGIIINELLTNSAKHAFPGISRPRIDIGLHSRGEEQTLTVADNGVGLPTDFDISSAKGFGMVLIRNLTEQLGGSLRFSADGGTRWDILFKKKALSPA